MSINSKQMKEIRECKNLTIVKGKKRCKLLNKRAYLLECKRCEHKSNMSIIDCFYKNDENKSCLDCGFCDDSWTEHLKEEIVFCHKWDKKITTNSRCEYYYIRKRKN